jgi:hypothetical protein
MTLFSDMFSRQSKVGWLAKLALLLAACSSHGSSAPVDTPGVVPTTGTDAGMEAGSPFEPLSPEAYGTKIKMIMVGRPLDETELASLRADPQSLRALVDKWMADPAWRERLLGFFEQSFQQTQVSAIDYDDQLGIKASGWKSDVRANFERAAEESFARTVLQLLDEGRPFTDVVTTQRYMLTPPLMALLAFTDAVLQDDDGNPVRQSWLLQKYPGLTLVGDSPAVAFSETIDPASPNFFHFQFIPPAKPGCTLPLSVKGFAALPAMAGLLFGKNPGACANGEPIFTEDDFGSWKMVNVRAPAAGEERTVFWDLPALRAGNDLVLVTPRVGFMTTPAFFANWPTNNSNQMRVTMNQTLIVALGTSFDDRDSTTPVTETTSDAAHVQPGTVCYGCHSRLDPMRNFFRQSFNYYYSQQTDPAKDQIPDLASFALGSSAPVSGSGIRDLAGALAKSELFAVAWAQKLCRLGNSASCSFDDPEFERVAAAFRDSNYDFKVLVREMFSSPLVTFATRTKSADDNGIVIGIQRRETLCTSLAHRLGISDVCSLHGTEGLKKAALQQAQTAQNLAGAVPGDGYARGSEIPLMPHDPNLFFASGIENLCERLATQTIDAAVATKWSSGQRDAAISDFVSSVMGLPMSDERVPDLRAALEEHYGSAVAAGKTPTDALRSTFIVACSSPLSVSLGI